MEETDVQNSILIIIPAMSSKQILCTLYKLLLAGLRFVRSLHAAKFVT